MKLRILLFFMKHSYINISYIFKIIFYRNNYIKRKFISNESYKDTSNLYTYNEYIINLLFITHNPLFIK